MKKFTVALLMMTLAFFSCQNKSKEERKKEIIRIAGLAHLMNVNKPRSNTLIELDEETRKATTSIDDDFTSIQFSSKTAQFKTLAIGDVVIGNDALTQADKGKGSYIVRIKGVDWINNTLLTEFIPLDDGIQGKWQVTSDSSGVVSSKAIAEGIQTSVVDNGQVVINFDETVDFANGVKIGGKIVLTSNLKLFLDFDNGLKNVDFTSKIVSTKQLRMNVKDANIKKKFAKDLIKYVTKPIKVYGLLYITPVITLRIEVDVDGTITLNTNITKTSTFKTALKYSKTTGWVAEKDVTNSETTSSVDATGSGAVKVGLGPQISLVLMNRISAYTNLFATGKGEISVDPVYSDVVYAIYGGYRVDMGVGIDIFGKNLGFKVDGLLANESQIIGGMIKTPPKIETLDTTSITPSSATIIAGLNRPASMEVYYGLSESNLSSVKMIGGLNQKHIIALDGLTTNTSYFYKVIAVLDNKKVESQIKSFTTQSSAPSGSKPELVYNSSNFILVEGTSATILPTKGAGITSCKSEPVIGNGLSLGSNCGISGTPVAAQVNAKFTITASNSYGSTIATIWILIKEKPPTLNFLQTAYNLTKGANTQISPITTGKITACASNSPLPAGLSLNATTCAITGTPNVTLAATSFTITASNSGDVATDSFTLTIVDQVNPKPELAYSSSSVAFIVGVYGSLTPKLASNISSIAVTPALSNGLAINVNGVISGSSSTVKSSALFTITAKNTYGDATTTTLWIEVKEKAPTVDFTSSTYNLTKGVSFHATPITTGTINNCSATPALPSGLSINQSTCAISGTSTVTLPATTFSIRASNSSGSGSDSFTLAVNERPNVQPDSPVFTSIQCFPWLNSTYTFVVKPGTDDNGDKVRIRCQISGTQFSSPEPEGQYVSAFVNGLDRVEFPVKFMQLGFQSMACRTEDEKGSVSNYYYGVSSVCTSASIKVVNNPY